jgi:CRISPR/Cas system-associated endonuclease Cas1
MPLFRVGEIVIGSPGRREQLAAYNDTRGVDLAKAIVRGKLGNQASLPKHFGKYLKESNPAIFDAPIWSAPL